MVHISLNLREREREREKVNENDQAENKLGYLSFQIPVGHSYHALSNWE